MDVMLIFSQGNAGWLTGYFSGLILRDLYRLLREKVLTMISFEDALQKHRKSTPYIYRNVAISASKTWNVRIPTNPAPLAVFWFHTCLVKHWALSKGCTSFSALRGSCGQDQHWGSPLGCSALLIPNVREESQSDEFVLVSGVSMCFVKHLPCSRGSHNLLDGHWSQPVPIYALTSRQRGCEMCCDWENSIIYQPRQLPVGTNDFFCSARSGFGILFLTIRMIQQSGGGKSSSQCLLILSFRHFPPLL